MRKKFIATCQEAKRDSSSYPVGALQRIGDQPVKAPHSLSSKNWKTAAAVVPRLAVAEVHEPSGGEQGSGKPGKALDAVTEAFPVCLSGNDAEHERGEQSEEDGGFEMGKREFRHGRQVSLSGLILFADGNLVGIHHGEDVQQPGSSKVDRAVIENEARR
jgi:hypothetical protein